ncbi:hypothetical protein D3C72_2488660 [compost metagenome]
MNLRHLSGISGDAMGTEPDKLLVEILAIGEDHAAFPRRDDLHRMEAENSHVREVARANLRIPVAAPDGMRGVL